jgi:cytochrome bd-type quinol oxidase subunit 2
MKKLFFIICGLLSSAMIFAQGGSNIQQTLNNLRVQYIRPALIGIILIMVLVGGIANMTKIRKGGEESKEGMMSWGMMVLWPVIVFAVVEGLGYMLL